MSRKAKITIYRDRLEAISACPSTIFNNFEPSANDFDRIRIAEGGDVEAIDEICVQLFDIYKAEREPNSALLYFLRMGLARKSEACAAMMIRAIDRFNTDFEYLDEALELLCAAESRLTVEGEIEQAIIKSFVAAPSPECDFARLNARIREAKSRLENPLLIHTAIRAHQYAKEYDREVVQTIANDLGIGGITALALLGGNGMPSPQTNTESELGRIISISDEIDMQEWRDLWLAVLYEYALVYLGGDLSRISDRMLDVISARSEYRAQPLHVLAVKRYMLEHELGPGEEEIATLDRLCRFNGLITDAPNDALIREAVDLDSSSATPATDGAVPSAELSHERNRYTLEMTLTGHKKRAARHQWDCTISLCTEDDTPPIFKPIPIVERRAEISRNGITFDKEKKAAQVLCAGEVQLKDKISPIELDLIVDISYVSTTKCTHAMIRVERVKRQGKRLVMLADISLYDEKSNK